MLNKRGFSAQYRLRTVVYALFILPGFGGTALADHYTPISEYVPELQNVSIISTPFVGTTYGVGEVIKVQMKFVWPVIVTGTPRVQIRFHDGVNSTINVQAQYTSGSGSSRLKFHYTVASTDADNNGLEVSSPIDLNNGSIKDSDSNNSLIDLTFTNVSADTDHMVNGGNDNRAPMLSSDGISIISTPFMGTTYGVGEVIKVQAQFLRPVSVDVSAGTPSVQIRFRDEVNPTIINVQAQYTSGSGSDRLQFHYTVASADKDNNGLAVRSPINLNDGVIQDIGYEISVTGDIDFTNVSAGADHKVDGSQNNRVPMLSSDGISIISAPYNGTAYQAGEVIKVQAQFLRPVSASVTEGSSRPKVRLNFRNAGAGTSEIQRRFAQYASGSGSSRLEFHYTVQSGNTDDNGLSVSSPVRLYDQDITDLVTGVAISNNIAFDNIGSDPAHKVDGSDTSPTAPKVRSADIITPPGLSTLYDANPATVYGLGDIIKVGVQLFRSVTVDVSGGTPSVQLKLYVGSSNFRNVDAAYTSGSGSDELEFHYVVAEGDTADSIELWSPINLNGGTIKDKDTDIYASGDLDLFESSFISIDQKVDYSHNNLPKMPKIIGVGIISTPQMGTTYGLNEVIKVQINFPESVIVDVIGGTPSVELDTNMYAQYHSGSGSDALEFHYEVQSSDNDANGIEVISPVQLNGGTIQNQSGGDSAGSDLAFNDIPANTNHKVDGSQENLGPAVTLSVNSNQVTENGGAQAVTVTATLANTTVDAVTVTLSLSGTAIEGTGIGDDYSAGWNPTTRQISIAAGSTSGTATVTITPTDDSVYENDETIVVDGNSSLGGQVSAATVALAENEAEPAVTLSVSPNSVDEDGGAQVVTVMVGLESAVASPTRVQLLIADESTAALTGDYSVTYEPVSRMLTIPAGNTTCPDNIEVVVTPVDDSIYEGEERIILSSTLSGYTVSDATVTLLDNDVKLEVSPTSLGEGAGITDVTVTATLPREVLSPTTVALSLGGTATQGIDYTVSGTQSITIAANANSGTTTLTITPVNDKTWEPDETIMVSGSATNFTVMDVAITLSDNEDVPIDQMTFITSPASGDMYQLGEAIVVGINFKEIVYVDTRGGTPTITLSFGAAASGAGKPVFSAAMLTAANEEMRIASYVRGSGTTVLVFAYTVEAGDHSTNGIAVVSNSLSFNGGTIQDVGGNPVETTHEMLLIPYNIDGGPPDNTPPEFLSARAIREVAENTPAGEHVGDAVTASDADGDAVTYSLSGDGAAFFAIDAATGQLIVGDSTVLNYESDTTAYGLMVVVDDGNGGVDSFSVTVSVTDVDEPPGKPDAPTVAPAAIDGRTSLAINWTVPSNTGPAIEDYDVAYSVSGASTWIDASYDGAETAILLVGLAMGTAYEVRVRASNDEGIGQWSDAGIGNTDANTAPVFSSERVTFEVAENTPAGEQVGDALTASDADEDVVTYSLSGDDLAFAIDAATGQLTVGDGAVLNYESDTTTYGLMVMAADGYGGVDSLSVMVTVTDVDEPPGKPEAPTIVPADRDGDMILAISWMAPSNTGPAIEDYDVIYRVLGTSAWIDANYDGVEIATLLTGLTASTAYEVRVRASNDEGTGQWSDVSTGNTAIARPDAPVNLTAHPGDGEVTLIWDDPQNATITAYQYRLSDANWIDIPHSLATTTQYTITGLVNGTVYTFALRAVNSTAAGQAVEAVAMPVVLVNVSFEADSYTAREGSEGVRISVVLDNVADREILLPIASEVQAGTEVEDYTLDGLIGGVLHIAIGARAAHFTVTAQRDADREDERVVFSFGDLPVQVSAGVPSRATVLLEDLDKAVAARLKALNQAILPEVARAMTASAMDAIANRLSVAMSATSSQGVPGREISLGGYPLSFGAPATLPRLPVPDLRHRNETHKRQPDDPYHYRQEDPLQMLTRSSFVLPVNVRAHADSNPRAVRDLMLWGSGTYRNLNSRGAIDWHGDLLGGHIGADARVGKRGLAGVLLSIFKGSFTYSDTDIQTGDYESQMLSVYPYLGWSWQSGLRVWAAGGLGTGEIGIDGTAYQMGNQSSAMSLQTLAMGASGLVLSHGSSTLRLKGEAWMTQVGLDARGLIDALTVDVQRTRLTLEGSHGRTFSSGGHLTQLLELGLRYDKGDGATGGGVEVGGGLRYVNASGVLTIEGRGRSLLVHQSDYREWGASVLMALNPGGDSGGLSFRLVPVYGQAQSGINQLYDSDGISAVVGGQNRQSHLDAEVGYGWSSHGGMLKPYIGLSLSSGASQSYLAGWCFEVGPALSMSLEAERYGYAYGVRFQARVSY